ncbi:unnamed protein product, partial [Callosobruchus maculatus]
PPPSYDSLFGRVREARKSSKGALEFLKNVIIIILGTRIFGIVKQLLHLSARVRQTEAERREENLRQSPTQTLLNCFMLGWFIIDCWSISYFNIRRVERYKL